MNVLSLYLNIMLFYYAPYVSRPETANNAILKYCMLRYTCTTNELVIPLPLVEIRVIGTMELEFKLEERKQVTTQETLCDDINMMNDNIMEIIRDRTTYRTI